MVFTNESEFKKLLASVSLKLGFELMGIFWHGYSKIPQEKRIAKIKEQMNEKIKIDPSFCSYRVDSEQNRKINEIAEGLKSGKIIWYLQTNQNLKNYLLVLA